MNSSADHVWHVWINQEANRLDEWEKANPTGETTTDTRRGKPVETPTKPRTPLAMIDPHERGLYDFKSAIGLIPWLTKSIGAERKKQLSLVHQQCSHQSPEVIPENHLQCWLGQRLDSCPILQRLRATFDKQREQPYYAERIKDEDVDHIAALTCAWHMLMGQDGFVDWNEGAVQDSGDRRFWNRVYENLAGDPGEQPEAED